MIFNAKMDLGYVYPSYQYQENQPVFSNIDRVELKSYYCIQYHGALTELTSLTFTQLKEYTHNGMKKNLKSHIRIYLKRFDEIFSRPKIFYLG